MKFLIDMPVSPNLVQWLNKQGHNAVHVSTLEMGRATDQAILDYAAKEKYIVITADLDFSRLIALSAVSSPGLILFRGGNYTEEQMRRLLERVLQSVVPEHIENSIVTVDKFRIRRISLPIIPS